MEMKEIEAKFGDFRNTIWCLPEYYEKVNKHKEVFTAFFKDKLVDPVVNEDVYAPVGSILVVLDNLELKVIKIK